MKVLSRNNTINYFSPDLEPSMEIELDETFVVETKDCYGGQVKSEGTLRPDIDISIMNQATGPIYVNKVFNYDVIKVHIINIELGKQGIMMMTNGLGVLGDEVQKPTTKLLPIENNQIIFHDHLSFPTHPMIGVIGVATEDKRIHTAVPGCHGGNLDTKDITIGNAIYLPVFQEGALLALGDLHASMGDGELDGTGVEIDGNVTLSISKVENRQISNPIIESPDSFYFVASEKTLDEAIKECSMITVKHLQTELSLDFQNAYRILSAWCDIRISQVVNELVTVRIRVPKEILPQLFIK